jgi:hypothetical protein
MTDKQSWKRADSRNVEKKFRIPKVVDEEDEWLLDDDSDIFDDYEGFDILADGWDQKRKKVTVQKVIATLFGLATIVSVYAVAIFFGLTALGVDSLEYRDAVIISASFVFIRFIDATLIEQTKKR